MARKANENALKQRDSSSAFKAAFPAFFLLLAYPFLGMLWHHDYPVFSAEVFVYFLFSAPVALLLALMFTRVRDLVGYALIILTLVMVWLLHFNLFLEGQLISMAIALVLVFLGREKTPLLLIPILAALITGAYFDARLDHRRNDGPGPEVSANPDLPPVIHLLMDSFAGPEGLPADMRGYAVAARMRELFDAAGFTLFPRAYSHYSSTVDTMTYAFNFEAGNVSPYSSDVVTGADHGFPDNRYFDALAEAGYRIRVYQNEDMDFCQGIRPELDSCWTYTLPDLDSVRSGVDSVLTRTRLLVSTLLRQSAIIDTLAQKYGLAKPWGVSVFEPGIFQAIQRDLDHRPGGVVHFAHVLFPHSPFAYSSDCRLNYNSTPAERFTRMEDELESPEHLLRARTDLYLEQVDCAIRVLGDFFDELRKKDLYDRSFIIVHGDHGSQISRWPIRAAFRDQLGLSDYREAFSVLYAFKTPGGKFTEVPRAVSLETLLARSLGRIRVQPGIDPLDFSTEVSGIRPYIYLLGTNPMHRLEIDLFGQDSLLESTEE